MQQRRSRRVISHQPGERPNTNQIIIHQAFGNADYKNQTGADSVLTEWKSGVTAPNTNDYFINQIRPCMRERHAVFDHTRMDLLAGEHLFKESFRVLNLPILRHQPDDLAQRVWHFPGAQPKNDLSFVEKIGERDSHWKRRFIGLSGKSRLSS